MKLFSLSSNELLFNGTSVKGLNREQRRAAVKAHPAVVDFRAQEAAKAARRAQLKAELEALDNA